MKVRLLLIFLSGFWLAAAATATTGDVDDQRQELALVGYSPWHWMASTCANCDIYLLGTTPQVRNPQVQAFLQGLSSHKAELQQLYGISGPEYTLLAQMAVGVLGRESKFFTSTRYELKEEFPWAVHLLKIAYAYADGKPQDVSLNSRGPTQIKAIPKKITDRYGITPDNISDPEKAAIATMGFLIESLGELKRRVVLNHLDFVTPETYVDYLPYIYFGGTKALIEHRADPTQKKYVQDMKNYMSWVEVYEREPSPKGAD